MTERADSAELGRWWTVYRNANEDFSQGFAEQYQELIDVPYCRWIIGDGARIGGLVLVGNRIGDLFLIPPFTDAYRALRAILPAGEFAGNRAGNRAD